MEDSEYERYIANYWRELDRQSAQEPETEMKDTALFSEENPRVAEAKAIASGARSDPEKLEKLFAIIRNPSEPIEARHSALTSLRALRFNSVVLDELRAAYLDALRDVIDDPDPDLRDEVLEILSKEKDEYAQRRLLESLTGQGSPLVPAQRALQLLSYDIHAEHFPLLREYVARSDDAETRLEAVRLLSADPASADLLMDLFADSKEDQEIRRASVAGLLSLAPQQYEERVKEIVLDDSEDETVRAEGLSALSHFGNPTALAQDERFNATIEELRTREANSESLEKALQGYMQMHLLR